MTDASVNINFSCISVTVKKENNGMNHGTSSRHDTGIEERNGGEGTIEMPFTPG
ncbi:MAG: hypothetical protein KJN62_01655 [Deltaproteobacteria bacterium]|nr:hypothetical protein [Deltaproteobacteria bacterium]